MPFIQGFPLDTSSVFEGSANLEATVYSEHTKFQRMVNL
jgi:hypothetical protein